jgi:hypothetical protein
MIACMKKPVRPRIFVDCDDLDAIAVALMKLHTGKTPKEMFLKLIREQLTPYMAEAKTILDKRKKP